jgi:hypothetical protein
MKQDLSRTVAKNLVIAATMGLAVVASWTVTDVRPPVIEVGTVSACSPGTASAGADRICKGAAGQS